MTPANSRPRGASLEMPSDPGLLAGLWQEVSFTRLPADAPPELDDYVQDIEDPGRIYAIHRASRRHNFQLLLARSVITVCNAF